MDRAKTDAHYSSSRFIVVMFLNLDLLKKLAEHFLKFSFFFGDDVLKGPGDQPHPIPKTFELTRDKVLLHTMHPASPALRSLFSYDLCYRRCGDYGMPTT